VINTTNFKVPAYVLSSGINALGLVLNLGRNGVTVYSLVEKPGQRICSNMQNTAR
jgi:hypothetical protein